VSSRVWRSVIELAAVALLVLVYSYYATPISFIMEATPIQYPAHSRRLVMTVMVDVSMQSVWELLLSLRQLLPRS